MPSSPTSCVIPVYNGERYLAQAIESVLLQTEPVQEIIVVDDGSNDGSGEVARRFGSRIRYERQERRGVSAARNRGVTLAAGDLICFLDADDLFIRRKMELQTACFGERSDLELCVALTENFWSPELRADERDDDAVWTTPWAGHLSTWVLRRSLFDRIGGFDETMPLSQDVDWHMRAVKAGAICETVPEILSRRRLHAHNNSRLSREACRAAVLRSTYRHIVEPRRRGGA